MSTFSTASRPANVIDLAADEHLSPEVRTMEVEGKPEQVLNVDGVIALMRDADTPEARALYRGYRKMKTRLKRQFPELEDHKLRERALMEVMPVRLV